MAIKMAGAAFAQNSADDNIENEFLIRRVPVEFRLPPELAELFRLAAKDPDPKNRIERRYDHRALWRTVVTKEGKVDPLNARRFMNDYLSGKFANDHTLNDKRTRDGLSSLGFETIMALYESIASEEDESNSVYLRELNRALDIPDSFYEQRAEPMALFFDEQSKGMMERKWEQARREGRINAHDDTSFADAMAEALTNPPLWSAANGQRRMQLMQFVCDAYSDYIGESRVKVGLFKGQPGLKGFYTDQDGKGQEVIGINVIEMSNFQACIGIMMHERQHASQFRLAARYTNGDIGKDHPEYKAARIFAANRQRYGYLNPEQEAGMEGYRFQPLEMDAHNAGGIAEYYVHKSYARKPGVYSERKMRSTDKPDNKLAA